MLDQLTHATFEPLVGKPFRLHIDGTAIGLELIAATQLAKYPGRDNSKLNREPFSLMFRGPKHFVLPQCIYSLEQEALGRAEIFLVPIGPDDMGQRYEAIFN